MSGVACSALWAGKTWRAEAERWIEVALRERGIAVTGAIDQPRIRPWSTLLTVPTDAGLVWFKENCPGQAFEAPLLAVLADVVPDAVAAPLAVEPARGWLLTADSGTTLAERSGEEVSGPTSCRNGPTCNAGSCRTSGASSAPGSR